MIVTTWSASQSNPGTSWRCAQCTLSGLHIRVTWGGFYGKSVPPAFQLPAAQGRGRARPSQAFCGAGARAGLPVALTPPRPPSQHILLVQRQMAVVEEDARDFQLALKHYADGAAAQSGCLR